MTQTGLNGSPEVVAGDQSPRRGGRHRVNARPDSRAHRATAGRLSWGLADQAVSSLTNFAVGVVVARSLGATAFGVFSLAWVTYSVILNVSRGVATDPLVVRFSGAPTPSWREAVAKSSGTALGVGIVAGLACLLAGFALGGSLGAGFVALGVILPALMLQDSWRYAFFAAGHGRKAFINDIVWAGALVPALIIAAQHGSVFAFVLAWGLSGAVAAGYGFVQTRLMPRWSETRAWLRQQRDLGPRYVVENVSNSGGAQLRMYGLGAIAGLADVGAVRGADLLLGPFVAVLMGVCLVAVPEAARMLRRSHHHLRMLCLLLGGGQATGALIWGLALLVVLPDHVGQLVLGAVWEPASALIVPVTLTVMGISISNGAATGLRALGAARRSLRSQLITSAAYVTCGLLGALASGALGSSWGVAGATLFGSAVWWTQLRAGLRDHAASPSADEPIASCQGEPGGGDLMKTPRLSIGLPVYNGENYLSESLDALLSQTYQDFELIISDNASTDGTQEICERYAAKDPRIRYLRQPHNIGAAPNHNFVVNEARGEFFKWASHDDLFGRDLLARCVEVLDEHPEAVLSHAYMAIVDETGKITQGYDYELATDSPHAPERFRSLLFTDGGDDFYGVVRTDVMRRIAPHDSYHNAGRKLVGEMALYGRFLQVPEVLFFRRDHPGRGDRLGSVRAICANLDPRRARHSTVRLLCGYVLGYVTAIRRAPLTAADRRRCYRYLMQWLASRAFVRPVHRAEGTSGSTPQVDALLAARERSAS